MPNSHLRRFAPGVLLSIAVALAAIAMGAAEEAATERAVVEPLVLAILLGMTVRFAWPSVEPRTRDGVRLVAKDLLEVAVCLLGATMDVPRLFDAGPRLAVGIAAVVVVSLAAGVLIGRLAGLPRKLAILVASGNAICGNSAIAAVAPAIGAQPEDIAASIAFTAVMGVGMVLGLPLLIRPLGLSDYQFGVIAGLTVYSVPQVLAAAFAVSPLSGQIATLVKLARVLMLGPVVFVFAWRARTSGISARARLRVGSLVPWFIVGFGAMATARSAGVLPAVAIDAAGVLSRWLTIGAMAALGLAVDVRSVREAGRAVLVAVSASLAVLLLLALALLHLLGAR